jgi:two-component system, NarL family, response regulator YdfI
LIRVLIAAASPVVRAGLESLIGAAEGLALAGSVERADEAAARAAELRPDVVLVDLGSGGEAAWREILEPGLSGGEPAVVILSGESAPAWAADALRSGVRGVLPRDLTPAELEGAILAAAAGFAVLLPQDLDRLLSGSVPPAGEPYADGQPLTPRELEVLALLAEGAGNKEVAWKLGISEHTAKFHVASILTKLGAGTRTEAVTAGIRRGLILI